jgi:hypothetical protein
MVLAIPGEKGIFSVLQEAHRAKCDQGTRVKLSSAEHLVLADFRWLVADLTRRPTRIVENIPKDKPDTLGAQYAAAMGMGGVHSMPQQTGFIQPMLWRCPFPEAIQQRLVKFDNPGGDITNSELELAASFAQHDILAQYFDVREATIHNSSDNVANVSCQRKGATSSSGPTARILHLQAPHQRYYRYVPLFNNIAGEANAMANSCSHLWHLSDTQLFAHFALHHPQSRPWMLCYPRKPMHCALISALLMSASRPELQKAFQCHGQALVSLGCILLGP